jgi:AcrR family transcriptional regulator
VALDRTEPEGRTEASKRLMVAIQRAAAAIISKEGFAGASMQTLADELGLVKPTLYYHVQSKERLLYSLIVAVVDERIQRWTEVMVKPASASTWLAGLVDEHVAMIGEFDDELVIFTDELHHLSEPHLEHVRSRIAVAKSMVRDVIEAGCRSGEFSVSDPAVATTVVFAMLNSMVRWYRAEGRMSPEEFARETTSLILDGVVNSRSKSQPTRRKRRTT